MRGGGEKRALPARVAEAAAKVEAELSETYARFTGPRAILTTLVPGLSWVDMCLGTRGQNIASRRFEVTVKALQDSFAEMDEEKVDREFLESEEFYDLVWCTFEKGQRTRHEEVVRYCARVLRDAVDQPETRADAPVAMDMLSELAPDEINLAVWLYKTYRERGFGRMDLYRRRGLAGPGCGKEAKAFARVLNRLQARGIVRQSAKLDKEQFVSDLARLMRDEYWTGSHLRFMEDEYSLQPAFVQLLEIIAKQEAAGETCRAEAEAETPSDSAP